MRDKKITKILITIAVVIIVIMIIGVRMMMIFLDESNNYDERTNEEYMAILLDNKEDFEYVAKMMLQWPVRSCIDFDKGISSENQEIADEILNNEEFSRHLNNLYDLKEISYVIVRKDEIAFQFYKFPSYYHGGVSYVEIAEDDPVYKHKIDDHWVLYMIPNT